MAHNEKVFVNVEPVVVVKPPDKLNTDISLAQDEQGDVLNTANDKLRSDIPLAPDEQSNNIVRKLVGNLDSNIPLAQDEQNNNIVKKPIDNLSNNITLASDEQGNTLNQQKKSLSSEIPLAEDEKSLIKDDIVLSQSARKLSSEIPLAEDDNLEQKSIIFKGGCNTIVEPELLPADIPFSMIQNMRNRHPGLEKRKGCIKKHTTNDGANEGVTLFQFSKGKITERHFFAQMGDGDVLEAADAPPTVTAGAFGSEAFSGTSGQIPASWSILDDFMLYSNGVDQHQIYPGNAQPVAQFIVYKGGGAIPDIPEMGVDYTTEVTDGDSSTVAVLDSLGDLSADYDCIFVRTHVPVDTVNWTVSIANSTAAVLKLNYYNGAWTNTALTDNTKSGGATFGLVATNSTTWTKQTDEIPKFMFGSFGFWYQFYLDTGGDLDTEVEVSAVTYDGDWQSIQNVWDGVLIDIAEAQFYDYSATVPVYKTYASSLIEIDSMVTADKLYFNVGLDPVNGIYIDPGDTPNTTASTTVNAIYYWDGAAFTTVSTITDGTLGLSKAGWITFARKAWRLSQFGKNKTYGCWGYLTVDKTLNDNVMISMKVAPYFNIGEIGTKGFTNAVWKQRAIYTFGDESLYVSAKYNPMVLNGLDFAILQAGDGRKNKVVAMRKFHNELMVWQEEKGIDGGCLTLFEGYSPATFGKLVLSTKIGALNAKVTTVVDGALTSLKTDKPVQAIAIWLSHYGVFMSDGTVVTGISDDIQNYFDPSKTECIRRGYEDKMWLFYDSLYNIIRIGLVSGVSATKANVFPVFDLIELKWTFDVLTQPFSSMCEVEAASGDIGILQYGGGTIDGYIYQSNTGDNDVTTAIDAYATLEIDGGGHIINLRKVVLRIKSGQGACTLTPYIDGVAQSTLTIP